MDGATWCSFGALSREDTLPSKVWSPNDLCARPFEKVNLQNLPGSTFVPLCVQQSAFNKVRSNASKAQPLLKGAH